MSVERNLAVVAEHIENEARDPASVLHLYTEDVVQEFPARGLTVTGKEAIAENYRKTFAAFEDVRLEPIDRFATENRVVDDMVVRFRLVGDTLPNAPVPVGSDVRLRLVHIFHMRDGLIAREIVHENYQVLA